MELSIPEPESESPDQNISVVVEQPSNPEPGNQVVSEVADLRVQLAETNAKLDKILEMSSANLQLQAVDLALEAEPEPEPVMEPEAEDVLELSPASTSETTPQPEEANAKPSRHRWI